jgi:general secretion pathway protein A
MYEDFYHLSAKPFQLTPDQKFFFNSQVHNRAMSYLRYGLEQGEGFIVITGGVGTGKTMLVRNLFSELDDRTVMAAQLVTTQVEPEDMLRMVCASFGLAHEGLNKASLLHHLESVAGARHAEGKRVLLVVDEAQNLPGRSVEELRMLSNYQMDGRSLFQSFLLGQEEFKRTLQGPGLEQVRQRIIASYHLEPLGAEETQHYIEFRLGQAGWKGDPSFEPGVYRGIHEFSGGIPRRINALCDRLLLFACLEERHLLDEDALDSVTGEMLGEMGSSPPGGEPHPGSEHQQSTPAVEVVPRAPALAGPVAGPVVEPAADAAVAELEHRVRALELELERLQKTVHHERKLLRKAVLLQLDMDGIDDLD